MVYRGGYASGTDDFVRFRIWSNILDAEIEASSEFGDTDIGRRWCVYDTWVRKTLGAIAEGCDVVTGEALGTMLNGRCSGSIEGS